MKWLALPNKVTTGEFCQKMYEICEPRKSRPTRIILCPRTREQSSYARTTLRFAAEMYSSIVNFVFQYIPDSQGSSIRVRHVRGVMEFVAFPEKRRVKTWKGFILPYSDTVDKGQTFNTMRIDVGDSEFIALYVCIC